MKPTVKLQLNVTEGQAEQLRGRLSGLSFKVHYDEENQGTAVAVSIACTPVQENFVREILRDVGAGAFLPSIAADGKSAQKPMT